MHDMQATRVRGARGGAAPALGARAAAVAAFALAGPVLAASPFAARVVRFDPAPGQFVNDDLFNDPAVTLGRPYAGGFTDPDNSSLVSLGAFGGRIVLGFDAPVRDDPFNPFGLDCIVFGNAFYVAGNPNRRWAECAHIEISRDTNGNGLDDDPWYVVRGSHIASVLPAPAGQFAVQTWDDDVVDPTWPPEDELWIPPGQSGLWSTSAWRLPDAIFGLLVVQNPNGLNATTEGVWGYADFSPTLKLGDLDGDDIVDDPTISPEIFYTRPDDPFKVRITHGSGGGDAFDIAWAADPVTGAPVNLPEFDFIRITTAAYLLFSSPLGELSAEIDAVADVREGVFGDADNDDDWDLVDAQAALDCLWGPDNAAPSSPCRVMDDEQDRDVDLADIAAFGPLFGL